MPDSLTTIDRDESFGGSGSSTSTPVSSSGDDLTEEQVRAMMDHDSNRDAYQLIDIDPMEDGGMFVSATKDALGRAIGEETMATTAGLQTGDPYGSDGLKVMGMPLFYSKLDDPYGRTYSNTFESDLPIVFIQPGKPRINQKLFGSEGDTGVFNLGAGFNKFGNALVNTGKSVLTGGKDSWRDSRWMSFKPAMDEYFVYLDTLLDNVRGGMGLMGDTSSSDFIDVNSSYGMAFYMSKGSDVVESANNEYTTPEVAHEANSKQQEMREKRMIAQAGGGTLADKASHWIQEAVKKIADIPVIGSFVGALTENLDGSQLYYPDTWGNSTFEKMYTLEFKFSSPYGDARSIFNYVYMPFLSLLTLSLPIQNSYYSYSQPFIVRMSAPGQFEVDMGVIRSLTIERGGEGKWSAEKLPREISVRINVSDMYPQMILSPGSSHLKYNFGMLSYIDCLAGIRYDQLSWIANDKRVINVGTDRTSSLLSFRASSIHNRMRDLAVGGSYNIPG